MFNEDAILEAVSDRSLPLLLFLSRPFLLLASTVSHSLLPCCFFVAQRLLAEARAIVDEYAEWRSNAAVRELQAQQEKKVKEEQTEAAAVKKEGEDDAMDTAADAAAADGGEAEESEAEKEKARKRKAQRAEKVVAVLA